MIAQIREGLLKILLAEKDLGVLVSCYVSSTAMIKPIGCGVTTPIGCNHHFIN